MRPRLSASRNLNERVCKNLLYMCLGLLCNDISWLQHFPLSDRLYHGRIPRPTIAKPPSMGLPSATMMIKKAIPESVGKHSNYKRHWSNSNTRAKESWWMKVMHPGIPESKLDGVILGAQDSDLANILELKK